MDVSVVIPTYNRNETLQACLAALDRQVGDATFEVIVVDDGSTDETQEGVMTRARQPGRKLTYVRQQNRGPAAARNRGIEHAAGALILFLGDDILATPGLVQQHVDCHRAHPAPEVAAIGRTLWTPALQAMPLIRLLDETGSQFDYSAVREQATFWHFYTSNLSLKRAYLLRHHGFDEDFPYAAHEDTELGFRMARDGLRIEYLPDALAYHDHPTTIESHLRRAITVGTSAAILEGKHPGIIKRPAPPLGVRARRYIIAALAPLIERVGTPRLKAKGHMLRWDTLYWRAFNAQMRQMPRR